MWVHDGEQHTSMCHINACQVFLKHAEQSCAAAPVGLFISLYFSFYLFLSFMNIFKHVVCLLCVFPSDNYIYISLYWHSEVFIQLTGLPFLFILVGFTDMFEDDIKCFLKLAFMGTRGKTLNSGHSLSKTVYLLYLIIYVLAYLLFSIWLYFKM